VKVFFQRTFPFSASKANRLSEAAAQPALAANWLTFGGDPQRTGWAQDEKDIDRNNVKNLTLLWKASLDNEPRELSSLTAPVDNAKHSNPVRPNM
jgi:hypothetical protein